MFFLILAFVIPLGMTKANFYAVVICSKQKQVVETFMQVAGRKKPLSNALPNPQEGKNHCRMPLQIRRKEKTIVETFLQIAGRKNTLSKPSCELQEGFDSVFFVIP